MNKNIFFSVVLVFTLVFGIVGCDNGTTSGGGSGEGNIEKTLVIKDLPAVVFSYGSSGGLIGIFPEGTSFEQAQLWTGIVAGADLSDQDIVITGSGPYTLTIPLYNLNNFKRWTGSGTYDIYVTLYGGVRHIYKASSENFTSETTTIDFISATEIIDSETWTNVTSFSQIDGTWKAPPSAVGYSQGIVTTVKYTNYTMTFNATYKNVTYSGTVTETFKGAGLNWSKDKIDIENVLKQQFGTGANFTFNDATHSVTITLNNYTLPLSDAVVTSGYSQLNQNYMKLKINTGTYQEVIFTRQ